MLRVLVVSGLVLAQAGLALAQEAAAPTAPPAPAAPVAPPQSFAACGQTPPMPEVAEKLRNDRAINAAVESLNSFIGQVGPLFQCRQAAINAEKAALKAQEASLSSAVDSYNAELRQIEALRARLNAQVEAANPPPPKKPQN